MVVRSLCVTMSASERPVALPGAAHKRTTDTCMCIMRVSACVCTRLMPGMQQGYR